MLFILKFCSWPPVTSSQKGTCQICLAGVFILFQVDQLTSFPGAPSENGDLIAHFAQRHGAFFGGDPLGEVHVVDAVLQPDTAGFGTVSTMENFANLLRGLALDAHQADLPAGLILNDFAVSQGQTITLTQIADSANIDAAISGILHIISFLVFGIFLSLCVFIIS